jgi:hypothetical protein
MLLGTCSPSSHANLDLCSGGPLGDGAVSLPYILSPKMSKNLKPFSDVPQEFRKICKAILKEYLEYYAESTFQSK